jgi:peptidoglycan/LPS O-acetylase OafA/YrhL
MQVIEGESASAAAPFTDVSSMAQAAPAAASARFFRPELDGLRSLAALAVFFHHALPSQVQAYRMVGWTGAEWISSAVLAGAFGVDLFFVLSAYLITELLKREFEAVGRIAVAKFYARRVLRIWPLYFVVLFVGVAVMPRISNERIGMDYVVPFCMFVGNWKIALSSYPSSIIAPLWSVCIEEQFYVIHPWLMGIAKTSIHAFKVALALSVSALLMRSFLVYSHAVHPAIWTNTLSRLDPIGVGMALPFLPRKDRLPPFGTTGILLACVFLLIGISKWVPVNQRPLSWMQVPSYSLTAIACGLIVWTCLCSRPKLLLHPILAFLGRISYGIYAFHVLGLKAGRWLIVAAGGGHLSSGTLAFATAPVGLAATIALAITSWYLLERPFMLWRDRLVAVPSRPLS